MGCQTSKPAKASSPNKRSNASSNCVVDERGTPSGNCVVEGPVRSSGTCVVDECTLDSFDTRSRYSNRPIEEDFVFDNGEVLGEGISGIVTKARNRCSGEECAVKVLIKSGLAQSKLEDLHGEVNNYLKIDHPHIARLLHVYEDDVRVCLVMELCRGKELFDRLISKKQFSEEEAVHAAYQLLLAVAYLHKHNIIHCDLKLENLLYESDAENANLKLIDFGFSKVWRSVAIHKMQGTPSYSAPEVFAGSCTEKCDMWSVGVIIFLLLGGYAPFPMNDDCAAEIKIRNGDYAFQEEKWKHVSEQGQDFVRRLLVVSPSERMSASECLAHPWLTQMDFERRSAVSLSCSSRDSPDDLLQDLLRYKNCSRFKRAALTMMAHHLSTPYLTKVRDLFLALDTDKSGTITRDNFHEALSGIDLPEEEKIRLFNCIDVAKDGEIHYSEFVAATMQSRVPINQQVIREAFELFDVSRTGYITQSDLSRVFGGGGFEEVDISTLISECNGCQSGIDFKRFDQLLKEDGCIDANNNASPHQLRKPSSGLSVGGQSSMSTREGSLATSVASDSSDDEERGKAVRSVTLI